MFKYKSPLSRLLEGAGKANAEETIEAPEEQEEKAEPIADFNALRAALGGGNMAPQSYEETDDLLPEEDMPEFADETIETDISEAEVPEPEAPEDSPVVTLRLETDDMLSTEDDMLAAVAEASIAEDEAVVEIVPEPAMASEPEEVAEVEVTEPEPEIVEVMPEPAPEPEMEAPAPVPEPEVEAVVPAPQPEPVATMVESEAPLAAPAPSAERRGRVKTTFLGFERGDTHVQELIETSDPVAKPTSTEQTYPVGWLVVTNGPGRGTSITVTEGLMQIGRNDDQAIQLDFGDTGISRSNHAVIAYDPEDRKCYLGHGGKANLVRLNGKPVLSTVALSSGDLIRISETSIRFTAFCDDGFDWRDAD